jgi:hypothetical protein
MVAFPWFQVVAWVLIIGLLLAMIIALHTLR